MSVWSYWSRPNPPAVVLTKDRHHTGLRKSATESTRTLSGAIAIHCPLVRPLRTFSVFTMSAWMQSTWMTSRYQFPKLRGQNERIDLQGLLHPARILPTKVGMTIDEPYRSMFSIAPLNNADGGRIEKDTESRRGRHPKSGAE